MKPVFCNSFNLTHNKNRSEIVLTFSHVYTDHNFTMKNGAMTDVSAQIVDGVSSVLISKEGALVLSRLLNKMISDWGENPEISNM